MTDKKFGNSTRHYFSTLGYEEGAHNKWFNRAIKKHNLVEGEDYIVITLARFKNSKNFLTTDRVMSLLQERAREERKGVLQTAAELDL